jgi:hypothetical protein
LQVFDFVVDAVDLIEDGMASRVGL